jgi:lauroyl/myristoyl acyltransferase
MFVLSAAIRLVFRLKLAIAWLGFLFLRLGGRLLPTSVLSFLLWPPAAAWDLVQLRSRELATCRDRFPESWRPKRWRFLFRQSLGLFHAQFISAWPDRLSTAHWLSRCQLHGGSHLIGAQERDRGVVLASMHFGPSEILPYCFPNPDSLKSLRIFRNALSPPADVPAFLPVNEIAPLPHFSHVRQFLGPGRRLLVEVDVDRGMQFQVPFENRSFRMATGAIRLAAMADAELIPCLITETASWKFAIHFGNPVPRHYLGNSPDMQAAGTHLLGEFSKIITQHPEQCSTTLLRAMLPLPVNGGSDHAVVVSVSESR